eukprot:jgi/Astpho2/2053/Aster-00549
MGERLTAVCSAAQDSSLLVVGPGVLGSYAGILWQQQHPGARVIGQTNSQSNHDRQAEQLLRMGIQPRLKQDAGPEKFPYVLFSAPPSGSDDYPGEVAKAVDLWDGSGGFVFTSSAGLYTVEDGSHCNEDSPTAKIGSSDRTDRLLKAEQAVLQAGGNVVRFVGLYHADRGAHTFFIRQGKVARWGGYTVNLIHYEDAASLSIAALKAAAKGSRGQMYVGADGSPVTFQDMIDAALASGRFKGSVEFTGAEGNSKGKLMSNKRTQEKLDWAPKYHSFEEFMAAGGKDSYSASDLYSCMGAPHE